jgi:hypothetical protein
MMIGSQENLSRNCISNLPVTQSPVPIVNCSRNLQGHRFSINKYIMPCKYGIACKNKITCKYWHNMELESIQLCKYGQACKNPRCHFSHEMVYPFCLDPICSRNNCLYTHPCAYGVQCTNIGVGCWNDHPLKGNQLLFGKCNLLYSASKMAEKHDLKYFDIVVYSFGNSGISPVHWSDMANKKINPGMFKWIDSVSSYVWKQNETFQDFANEILGGGTLRLGNVQEEIMMRSLGLLQYLYLRYQNNKMTILSNNLKDDPILIETHIVSKTICDVDPINYGTKGLLHASKRTIAWKLYEPIDIPMPVKLMCVAMLHLDKIDGSSYSQQIIETAFQSLTKAFIVSLIANENDMNIVSHNIHIGNIGCGAFNHNINSIYIIQKLALVTAIHLVLPKKEIFITYHTYDQRTMDNLTKYAIPMWESAIICDFSIGEILEQVRYNQIIKPDIWAKKIF